MMKKIFVLAFILGAFSSVFAQNRITGMVVDQYQQALEGVSVSVKNSPLGAVTNADGSFILEKVKPSAELQFSCLGYESTTVKVSNIDAGKVNIVLALAPIVYDDFEVTATRAGDDAPFAINNIDAEELEKRNGGAELPELLKLSPSVVTSTENGLPFGNTKFRIRGSDPTRINVTVDGIPLNDAESQAVFWVNMTDVTESVSDIQIQRGVGASTNGAASFGASVNMQTKGYDANSYAEFSSYAGSYNTFKNSVQANTGLIKDHFVFNARLSTLASDGYINHSGLDHKSYFFSGGYFSDKTTFRVKVFGNEEHTGISWWGVTADDMANYGRQYNIAGVYSDKAGDTHYYEDQKDNYWQNHIHAHFSHKFSEALRLKAAVHYTHGEGYYEQFQDDDNWLHDAKYEDYGLANASFIKPESGDTIYASDMTRQKWLDNDFYGGTFSLEYDVNDLQLVFGASGNRYDGDHYGTLLWAEYNPGIPVDYQYYFNNSIKDDLGAFAKATYNVNSQLAAYADLQYRYVSYDAVGDNSDVDKPDLDIHEDYSFVNPKAGLVYSTGQHRTFASFGVSNREPSRANLKDAVGDAASQPVAETLYDTELGYQFSASSFTAAANVFYMNYKDQLVPTGQKNSVGYEIMTNVDESYRAGVELSAAYMPVDWLKWDANVTLSQNKIIDFTEYNTYYDEWYWNELDYKGTDRGNTNIAYSPNVVGASALTFYPVENLSVMLNSKYVGEQYFDNTSQEEAKLDAYFVNDLMLAYKLPLDIVEYVELKLMVNNIFDVDYISDAYGGKDMVAKEGSTTEFDEARWTYYFPQAFRNYAVKMVVRF